VRIGTAFAPIGMYGDASGNVYVSELETRRVAGIAPGGRRTILVRR
jgi:sugar lactone lactonase YvrE